MYNLATYMLCMIGPAETTIFIAIRRLPLHYAVAIIVNKLIVLFVVQYDSQDDKNQ